MQYNDGRSNNKKQTKNMKRTIIEESVLLLGVTKWLVLASSTGALVGLAATAFLYLLEWSSGAAGRFEYTLWLLPAALFTSSLLTRYLAPDAEGHGTEKVIDAIHQRGSQIPLPVVPVKLLATIVTLAIGGSAGKEGPCAQIGAGVSSAFARLLRLDASDRKKLVICGISAGFATVFGTPIAGAIFGVEVLIVGTLLYDVLLPSFIAGVTAYQVSSFFGVPYLHAKSITIVSIYEPTLLKVVIAGAIFGIISVLLIASFGLGKKLASQVRVWPPARAILGGGLLVVLALIFGEQYLGLGLPSIRDALGGGPVDWGAPLLKILFTSLTLNFGGSGGVVTPIFFIGSTSGAVLAPLLGLNPALLSAIGLVSVLAGAANTPIAASIMAVEMFGPSVGPYAAAACIVSYLVTGHRSIYPSQILAIKKSASLEVQLGKAIHGVRPSFRERHKTLASLLLQFWRRIRGDR